jgi:hypothetical protein
VAAASRWFNRVRNAQSNDESRHGRVGGHPRQCLKSASGENQNEECDSLDITYAVALAVTCVDGRLRGHDDLIATSITVEMI